MEDKNIIEANIIAELSNKAIEILEKKGLSSSTAQIKFLECDTNKELPINKLLRGMYDIQIGQFVDICLKVGLKPEIKYSILS